MSKQVFAVPSAEIPQKLIQNNGAIVYAIQKGDEWNNWMETKDGYTIEKRKDGNWYYFTQEKRTASKGLPGGTLANLTPPPNLKKGLRPKLKSRPIKFVRKAKKSSSLQKIATKNFEGNILFILAEFSNQRGSTTETSWANFISDNIADYYHKVSYGKVTFEPARETFGSQNNGVIGWVNIGNYHPNTGNNTNAYNELITKNAILAATPYINFASYDKNYDGYIDSRELAIVIIVAGYEASYGGGIYSPSVWGHAFYCKSPPKVDDVIVGYYHNGYGYTQFGEIHQSSPNDRHQATMGIMVHELGHLIFGFPDLYDIDYSSKGIGKYGVMGGGSWGAKKEDKYPGTTPVFPTAWTQAVHNWVNIENKGSFQSITAAGSPNASSDNTVYKYTTSNPNQYFLVQNRQDQGYDRGLEWDIDNFKGGLLIYHIDESQKKNTNDTHRLVDVEEADGSDLSIPPYPSDKHFWRKGNAVTFNNNTTPNSRLNNGAPSGVNIHSISESGEIMSVNFGNSNIEWLEPVIDLILN